MQEADCCEMLGYVLLRGKDRLTFKKDGGEKTQVEKKQEGERGTNNSQPV